MSGPFRQPCDEGVLRTSGDCEGAGRRKRYLTLTACVLGSALVFIDGSVVAVALPVMRAQLPADVVQTQWIVNIYMLMLAAFTLLGGAGADRFGRKRAFLAGVAGFAAASIFCGLAPSANTLIAARAFQGLAGAVLAPASLALIAATFPKSERGAAIGVWAGASALTTALGPVLGGWIVDALSWRYIFYLNIPIALAALAAGAVFSVESRDEAARRLDWPGAALAVLALGALAFSLTRLGERSIGDLRAWAALALSLILAAAFLMREKNASSPMMPLGIFSSLRFSALNALTLCLYAALSSAFLLLPFELTEARGLSAAAVGAVFLPFTLPMGFLSSVSGALQNRVGVRLLLVAGPVLAALGFALLAAGRDWPLWAGVLAPMGVTGFGFALFVAPLTDGVIRAAPERHEGLASGVNNAASRIAGMIGVALAGALAAALGGFTGAYPWIMAGAAVLTLIGAVFGLTGAGARQGK